MPRAKSDLESLKLRARKRFGQHFMTDEKDLCFIADSLGAQSGQTVLEIGPGLGALTEKLLEKGLHVCAVEKDRDMAAHLRSRFAGQPLELREGDILKFDLHALSLAGPIRIAGNIPYNITSPILFWLVDQRPLVQEAVLTVQHEVAERLTGRPGHEGWGAVSVSIQAYAEAVYLKKIPKGHFYPPPKVDSAVIGLKFFEKPRFDERDRELFHEIVAHAFQKRRKTLLNALENERRRHTRAALLEVFAGASIDPQRRPETLSVQEWVLLARRLPR